MGKSLEEIRKRILEKATALQEERNELSKLRETQVLFLTKKASKFFLFVIALLMLLQLLAVLTHGTINYTGIFFWGWLTYRLVPFVRYGIDLRKLENEHRHKVIKALQEEGIDTRLIPRAYRVDEEKTWEAISTQLRGTLLSPAEAPVSDLLRPATQPDTPAAHLLRAPSE